MIEVKVECACGQRFKFDVEPVNGLMPYTVNCPTCGADGTALANAVIQSKLPAQAPPPANVAPEPQAPARLRVHVAAPPAAVAAVSPPQPPDVPPSPGRVAAKPVPAASRTRSSGDSGFAKGVAGALVASLVGMISWFLLIKLTGYEIGIVAWGVGGLTGLGARLVGAESSQKLGVVAGLFALMAIIGGEYLAVRSIAEQEFDKIALIAYQEQLDTANAALALNGVEETKAFIAKQEAKEAADVTAEELKAFQEEELPGYREFVAGKPSKAQFVSAISAARNSLGVQFALLKESVSLFTLLWIFLGVGSAYKLGAGAND